MNQLAGRFAAMLLCVSGSAFAQGYVGVAAGSARLNVDCTGTTSCSGSDTGMKLFGGYRFSPGFAAELVYADFGKAKATVGTGAGAVTGSIKSSLIGIGVAASSNFTADWSGVARVGVGRVKADVNGTGFGVSASTSDTSTQAYVGLGLGYAVSKTVSLDAGFDFSRSKFAGESGGLRLFSVGATFSF